MDISSVLEFSKEGDFKSSIIILRMSIFERKHLFILFPLEAELCYFYSSEGIDLASSPLIDFLLLSITFLYFHIGALTQPPREKFAKLSPKRTNVKSQFRSARNSFPVPFVPRHAIRFMSLLPVQENWPIRMESISKSVPKGAWFCVRVKSSAVRSYHGSHFGIARSQFLFRYRFHLREPRCPLSDISFSLETHRT